MLDLWFKVDDKIRFLFVGGFNFCVSYLIYAILCKILGTQAYQLSLVLTWIITSVISFITQRTFVFQSKGFWFKEYCKCCTTWFFSYLINAFFLEIFVKYVHFNVYIAQIIATLIASIFTYIMFKFFAFKQNKKAD